MNLFDFKSAHEVTDVLKKTTAEVLGVAEGEVNNQTVLGDKLMPLMELLLQRTGGSLAVTGDSSNVTYGELAEYFREVFYTLKPWKRPIGSSA